MALRFSAAELLDDRWAVTDRSTGRHAVWKNRTQNDWDRESAHDLADSFNDLIAHERAMALLATKTLPAAMISTHSQGLILERQSDEAKWLAPPERNEALDGRIGSLVKLISSPATVLDLGCGAMALEQALPAGVTYIPADLVQRDERTILFDMNSGLFPDVDADVAVALGLLEYAHDPAACLKGFARWPRLILSYNPTDVGEGRDRLKHGWFSNLAVASVINLAKEAGFSLSAMMPCPPAQRIFDFARTP